jgi:hypothetical protein
MFAYGIGLLPLIRALKLQFPEMDQTWYADDAGAGGSSMQSSVTLKIEEIGPNTAISQSLRSIMIVPQKNYSGR